MKKILFMFTIAASLVACSNQQATDTNSAAEVTVDSTGTNYSVDAAASSLLWTAEKIVGGHNGNILLTNGSFNVKDGNITSGGFTIDMNSLNVLDIPSTEKSYSDLVGHLKSPDFFNVASFATGKFEITACEVLSGDANGNTHNVSGNLTIKDSVHNITFPVKVTINGDELTADGQVVINRLKWGILYNSVSASPADLLAKLGDKAIKDELTIKIALKAKKA